MVKFSRFDAADYLRDETDIAACLEAAREERPDVLAAAQADAARASGEARFLVIEDKWTCNQVQQETALLLPQARRADPAARCRKFLATGGAGANCRRPDPKIWGSGCPIRRPIRGGVKKPAP